MRVLVTGATGFLGRKLVLRLSREGYDVVALVRDARRGREVLGAEVELLETSCPDAALDEAMGRCDAVINLAGAPVAQRWTSKAVTDIVLSRVDATERLVRAMGRAERRPSVLVSASAVGYYGDRGGERLEEEAAPGVGFLADLCRRWEAAALAADAACTRVVQLRIGIVLGRDGGALPKMLFPFRLGLGAVLGRGAQYFPFIHEEDLIGLVMRSLSDPRYRGPINAVAPQAIDNRQFTRLLARAVGRRARLRVPAWALRLALGRQARIVLDSQRVVPRRALDLGFAFSYPTAAEALDDLVGNAPAVRIDHASEPPPSRYLASRPPRHRLTTEVVLDAPLEEVFAFFQSADNLGPMTPPEMGFRITSPRPIAMREGQVITYRIRLGPVRMNWSTSIERWSPPGEAGPDTAAFVDAQQRGPYACWYHEHRFERVGERTKMVDCVWYTPPLGPLGRLAHALWVRAKLREIFGYRTDAMAHRFRLVRPSVRSAA